ncbi:hypothetical protein Q9189_001331 [Teloschistes chrysophthalmus]
MLFVKKIKKFLHINRRKAPRQAPPHPNHPRGRHQTIPEPTTSLQANRDNWSSSVALPNRERPPPGPPHPTLSRRHPAPREAPDWPHHRYQPLPTPRRSLPAARDNRGRGAAEDNMWDFHMAPSGSNPYEDSQLPPDWPCTTTSQHPPQRRALKPPETTGVVAVSSKTEKFLSNTNHISENLLALPTMVLPCGNPDCPLGFGHFQGVYLHGNRHPTPDSHAFNFGLSNPPPRIWVARDHMDQGFATQWEVNSVMGFIAAHQRAVNQLPR